MTIYNTIQRRRLSAWSDRRISSSETNPRSEQIPHESTVTNRPSGGSLTRQWGTTNTTLTAPRPQPARLNGGLGSRTARQCRPGRPRHRALCHRSAWDHNHVDITILTRAPVTNIKRRQHRTKSESETLSFNTNHSHKLAVSVCRNLDVGARCTKSGNYCCAREFGRHLMRLGPGSSGWRHFCRRDERCRAVRTD